VSELELGFEPLGAANVAELCLLFERCGSGCYCQYWHFTGDKNAWLERLAFGVAENAEALRARSLAPGLAGVVARRPDSRVLGWMKLEPAAVLGKIYEQRPYRALPLLGANAPGVWAVGCFLVDPEFRRRGVARGLLATGIELARAAGARRIDAFPRRAFGVGDEELWTGPLALFEAAGFGVTHEQSQYPVLSLPL
jgi:GNAT superfamily N-acetyltransferase